MLIYFFKNRSKALKLNRADVGLQTAHLTEITSSFEFPVFPLRSSVSYRGAWIERVRVSTGNSKNKEASDRCGIFGLALAGF